MIKLPGDDARVVEAATWAKTSLPAFVQAHEGCLTDLSPENLYHLVFEALVAGYLSGRVTEMEVRDLQGDAVH